jgi:hypothetical protein
VTNPHSAALPLDLVPGGPTFRLLLRVGLANPAAPRLVRTAFVVLVATWMPLALLTLLAGTAMIGSTEQPFARDFAVHARLLLALPLFLLGEVSINPRLRAIAATFVRTGVVRDVDLPAYEGAVRSALRLRDSVVAEIVLIAMAVIGAAGVTVGSLAAPTGSWAVAIDASGAHLTAAGWWYALVGLPVFQFVLFRSLWRGVIWTHFLGAMSKLDLALVPTHPDHAGGLGFVGVGQTSWVPLVFAISIVLAASFADAVVYGGSHVFDFKLPIAGYGALVAIALLGPLLRFRWQLARAHFTGLLEYGALVHDHHLKFDRKWIGGREGSDESLLGSPDVSSLVDSSAGYELVASMRTLPIALSDVVPIAIAVALPMVALFAIEIPIIEIVKNLLAIIA